MSAVATTRAPRATGAATPDFPSPVWAGDERVAASGFMEPEHPITAHPLTVEVLILRFLGHASEYYGASREAKNLRSTLGKLLRFAADQPADRFRALALQTWRETLVDEGLSRGYINRCVRHARRCFAWGVAQELVDPSTLESLRAVPGLRAGRTRAVEPAPVRPVSPETILATLPHLTRDMRDMVELLRLTGARTGEIRRMRSGDIDTGRADGVWVYRPDGHKTAHHGKARTIPLDEPCQAILLDRLRPFAPGALLFASPRTGRAYAESSLLQAVRRACLAAGIPPWHPHQIRHRVLTEARGAMPRDPDAWRALAGHSQLRTTEVYAIADEERAIQAQREIRRFVPS
jgi:integrase